METITRYPTFRCVEIPDNQRDAASLVETNLALLDQWIGRFEHALNLFDFCDKQLQPPGVVLGGSAHTVSQDTPRSLIGWQFIAARDAALTIFHFGKSLDAAHDLLHRCQAVKATVDLKAIKEARNTFREKFPRYEAVRHGVSHIGELTGSPAKRDEHSLSGKYRSSGFLVEAEACFISDNLDDRVYTTLWQGQVWGYEIDLSTLMVLRAVADQVYKAFDPQSGINRLL